MTAMTDPNNPRDPLDEESVAPVSTDSEKETDMTPAYRLRGWLMPLCGTLAALVFCVMVPVWYEAFAGRLSPIPILVIGVLLSAVAIPSHLLGNSRKAVRAQAVKTLFLWVSIGINSLGSSLCMTAYYVHIQSKPTTAVLIAGALVSIVLYAILAILMQAWPTRYALLTGMVAFAAAALMIVAIVFWVKGHNKLFFSFAFFNLLWTLISVIALHVACADERSPCLRFASFASFGILMAVAAIVLALLVCAGGDCDCDCVDCCDCGGSSTSEKGPFGRKSKKRIKKI